MPNEIDKYKPHRKFEEEFPVVNNGSNNKSFYSLLAYVFIIGICAYLTNGIFPKWLTILLTFLLCVGFSIYQFVKSGDKLTKLKQRFGIAILILAFAAISFYSLFHDADSSNNSITETNDSLKSKSHTSLADSLSVESFHIDTRGHIDISWMDTTLIIINEHKINADTLFTAWKISCRGKTSAQKVRIGHRASTDVIPPDSLEKTPFGENYFSINPTEPYQLRAEYIITPDFKNFLVQHFRFNTKPLYFGIRVQYEDVFHQVHHSFSQIRIFNNGRKGKERVPEDD